ncbi:hypothetical protein [Paenibacillus gansuensis]|uniref:Uncharacterized protein n=1 Tax=Paenibacillus gansuensis TaxID=306542 RepID=A0ABW5PEE9_9BACL
MEQYQMLIGVVIEKLNETYQDVVKNREGLQGILSMHTEEERANAPELLTISELHRAYDEFADLLESRFPGLKSQ